MWPVIAAQAGMELGKGLAGYFLRPKIPRAQNTAAGRNLMYRSRYGNIDPLAERNILNTAGRASAAGEETQQAQIRGGLVRSGMDQSIAGERLLATPGLRRNRYLADTGEQIATQNEADKVGARADFAQLQDQQDAARRESKRQALLGLVGGGLNAAKTGVNTYMDEKSLGEMKDFDQKYAQIDLLIQAGKYDEAQRLMAQLFGGTSGAGTGMPAGGGLIRNLGNLPLQAGR